MHNRKRDPVVEGSVFREFRINLQAAYDLRVTIDSSASRIQREVRPRKAA